jgi:hypothetical protein
LIGLQVGRVRGCRTQRDQPTIDAECASIVATTTGYHYWRCKYGARYFDIHPPFS